jgi:hypothetical protein
MNAADVHLSHALIHVRAHSMVFFFFLSLEAAGKKTMLMAWHHRAESTEYASRTQTIKQNVWAHGALCVCYLPLVMPGA